MIIIFLSISQLCFNGNNIELTQTINMQHCNYVINAQFKAKTQLGNQLFLLNYNTTFKNSVFKDITSNSKYFFSIPTQYIQFENCSFENIIFDNKDTMILVDANEINILHSIVNITMQNTYKISDIYLFQSSHKIDINKLRVQVVFVDKFNQFILLNTTQLHANNCEIIVNSYKQTINNQNAIFFKHYSEHSIQNVLFKMNKQSLINDLCLDIANCIVEKNNTEYDKKTIIQFDEAAYLVDLNFALDSTSMYCIDFNMQNCFCIINNFTLNSSCRCSQNQTYYNNNCIDFINENGNMCTQGLQENYCIKCGGNYKLIGNKCVRPVNFKTTNKNKHHSKLKNIFIGDDTQQCKNCIKGTGIIVKNRIVYQNCYHGYTLNDQQNTCTEHKLNQSIEIGLSISLIVLIVLVVVIILLYLMNGKLQYKVTKHLDE